MPKNSKTLVIRRGTSSCSSCRYCDKSFDNLRPATLAFKLLELHYKKCHPTQSFETIKNEASVGRESKHYKYQN